MKNHMKYLRFFGGAIPVLQAINVYAIVETHSNFEDETLGDKPQTKHPVAGSVAVKPTAFTEADNVNVRIDVVDGLKGNALVIEDDSSEPEGQGSVVFGQGASANAVYSGKVYIHLDWLTVDAKGNSFLYLQNGDRANLLELTFPTDRTSLTVAGAESAVFPDAMRVGEPVAIAILLDLDQWTYEIK
ncbi:MAG TPA: hypothetical protein PLS03_12795, partial [Terrimicrobiaceae bacterium]|nr:hypothetical protein [Terrimicrobiaceae bacterium]